MVKQCFFSVSLLLLSVTLLTACEKNNGNNNDSQEKQKYAPGTIDFSSSQKEMVNSNNEFALQLFKHVLSRQNGSVFCSPISATYALSMLTNGTAGDTHKELMEGMGFGKYTISDVNTMCHKFMTDAPNLDKTTTIDLANAVIVNKEKTRLKDAFKAEVESKYYSVVKDMEFSSPATLQFINDWAKEKTHGMIPSVLDKISPEAISYLMNAIYFKGKWFSKFDKDNTKKEKFTTEDGKKLDVMMMHQNNSFAATVNDTYKTVVLPYGNGSFEMSVLLPVDGKTVTDVLAELTAEKWRSNRAYCREINVDLKLPKFTTFSSLLLNETLKTMGMKQMFNPELASLSLLTETPAYVSFVLQKAKIELEEEGTKAAAVTVIGLETTALPGEVQNMEFHADHPFVYAITEHSTGTILFMGVYKGDEQ